MISPGKGSLLYLVSILQRRSPSTTASGVMFFQISQYHRTFPSVIGISKACAIAINSFFTSFQVKVFLGLPDQKDS